MAGGIADLKPRNCGFFICKKRSDFFFDIIVYPVIIIYELL